MDEDLAQQLINLMFVDQLVRDGVTLDTDLLDG